MPMKMPKKKSLIIARKIEIPENIELYITSKINIKRTTLIIGTNRIQSMCVQKSG